MIYITGDIHGNPIRLSTDNFPEQKEMTKDDCVIVAGDFGLVWDYKGQNSIEKSWLDWLESKSFTTLFVDGNHENFDRLNDYPVEEWHGGKVHKIRPSVIHLMRGQVFNICGKLIFTFGGASSHDIDDGILELVDPDFRKKKKCLDVERGLYRINHISWWQEELPSTEEMEEGRRNLMTHNNAVDFIVSHCCASSTAVQISKGYNPDILTQYFEEIKQTTKFKKWIFGHYHDNINVTSDEILLYEQIIRIA